MGVEKESAALNLRAARTEAQLHATLQLLARLEFKYSQVCRKLGWEGECDCCAHAVKHIAAT